MKTKNRPGRATISKIPSKPSSMAARVLYKMAISEPRMSKLERLNEDDTQLILHKRDGLVDCGSEQLLEGCHPTAGSLMERSGLAREKEDDSTRIHGEGIYTAVEGLDQCVAAKRLKKRTNDVHEALLHGPYYGILVDEAKYGSDRSVVQETLSSSNEYHDRSPDYSRDKVAVATKELSFLSSQNTGGLDFLATEDWTEEGLCIKCDEGGQVLICNGNDCSLVIHENCLGCSASFDDMGNFYCPFCSYRHAISESHEAKKKVAVAKEALSLFLGKDMIRRVTKFHRQAEPSITCGSDNTPCRKEDTTLVAETFYVSINKTKTDNAEIIKNHLCIGGGEQMQSEGSIYDDAVVPLVSGGDHAKNYNYQCGKVAEDQRQAEPYIASCREEETALNGEVLSVFLNKGERDKGKMFEETHHTRGREEWVQACGNIARESSVSLSTGGEHALQVDHQQRKVIEDQLQKEPSTTYSGEDLPCKRNSTLLSETIDVSVSKRQRNNQNVVEECQAIREAEKQVQAKANNGFKSNLPCGNTKNVLISQRHAEKRIQSTVVQPQILVAPHELNFNAEGAGNKNEEDIVCGKSIIKHQRPANRSSSSAFPNSRRKKLPWTAEEEEMLKEGVHKFSSTVAKNLPWRKILEYGCLVFDGSRTPVDLKDKWRNILIKDGSRERWR